MFAENKVGVRMLRKRTRRLVRSWYKSERDWNGIKAGKISMIRGEDGLYLIKRNVDEEEEEEE